MKFVLVTVLVVICLLSHALGKQPTDPQDPRLKVFYEYHSSSMAPGSLLKKSIPQNVVFTYEFATKNGSLDVYLFKSEGDYLSWKGGNYTVDMTYPAGTAYQVGYKALEKWLTPKGNNTFFVISNPVSNPRNIDVQYNHRWDSVINPTPIILGSVLGFVGLVCCCCIGLLIALAIFLCIMFCRKPKKEYLPVQETERVF